MRCSRVVLSLMVAIFGGAVMALSSAEACPSSATEQYSMIPSDLCPTEDYRAAADSEASDADVGQAEEADYYDRGEVAASVEDGSRGDSSEADSEYRYEYPEESYSRYGEAGSEADDAEQYYTKQDSRDASPEAQSDYHDQYSEEGYGNYGEVGSETEYAEQHYSKYGYQYASPEEKYGYGYATPYAESDAGSADSANDEPMSQESADAEAGESYRNADSQETDKSSAPDALATNDAEEAADEMPSEGRENAWETQRDMEQESAPANPSPESAYQEHGVENLTTGEESDTAETHYPTEEEMLARTELPDADAVATERNDEIGPYQMEEYHPRYGYRFGHRRSYYATPASDDANTSSQSPTTAAAPTPAAETESVQSEPQPGSVADRYGYAEYMGEDYLSELEDSSRAAADPEQQPQVDPENTEPMDPENGAPVTPERNASIDSDSREMAFSENYDYAEPYRYYGHDYWRETADREENGSDSDQTLQIEESSSMQEPQAQNATESGIELFAYRPTELLTSSDQDLLRTLSRLFEEPSGVRRAALNDYLETQGTNALDFAARFEDLTGIEFLGLADDLPGVAAFLASYRLLEQSELGVDEASDLLRRSLQRLAPDWIEGVDEITANAQESTSEPVNADGAESDPSMGSVNNQVLKALGTLASQSLRGIGELSNAIPARFSQVAWTVLLPQFGQDWSIGSLSGAFGDLQR